MAKCICMSPPFFYKNFDEQFIGTDMTDSRYGEVSIKICKKCSRKWLNYLVEYEAFTESGRWFRGLITEHMAQSVTPGNAVSILESLVWRFKGGSYFRSTGMKSTGPLQVNLNG